VLLGLEQMASSIAFGPDGSWLAAGEPDGRVVVWRLADHRPLPADPAALRAIIAEATTAVLDGDALASPQCSSPPT
jgi:hypothetical protein